MNDQASGLIPGLSLDQEVRLLIVGIVLVVALTADRLILRRLVLAGVHRVQRMPVLNDMVTDDVKVAAWVDRTLGLMMVAGAVLFSLAVANVPIGPVTHWLIQAGHAVLDWLRTSGVTIAIVLVFGFIAWKLLLAAVQPFIKKAITRGKFGTALDEANKRATALAQVAGHAIRITILVTVLLMILSALGVSIAPLIAGASVVGIAVGFGAQNTVRDIIAGAFILGENQYRVGDVASVGGKTGLVEGINLRRTTLRDLDGVVHYIPNGEITVASNYTKDFSRVNMNIGVAYKEDLDRVIRVLNRVGFEIASDSYFGPLIIEAPRAVRVDNFGDSAIEVKVLGVTQPIRQWEVMGELRRRIKRAFDNAGIEIPFPHRTLYWGEGAHPAVAPVAERHVEEKAPAEPDGTAELGADPFVSGAQAQAREDEANRKDLLLHLDAMLPLLSGRKLGLLVDIDGTLARINPNPMAVTITPAKRQMLDKLAKKASVAILSGRSVADARNIIGLNAVTYVGNHGVQWWYRGKETVVPGAEPYIRVAHDIAVAAKRHFARVPGIIVEDKGPSVSLHYRAAVDQAAALAAIEKFLATSREASDLVRREGKLVVELRPPVHADKGTALKRFVEEREVDSVIVLGDDYTDLDGFNAAKEFAADESKLANTVAVLTVGTPQELIDACDFTLDDTDAVEDFLTWLAGQV